MALNLSTLTSSATSGDVLAEALTTADFLENVPVLRNLSRGSNKGGDAKQDVALNQPKALPYDGKGYLYLSGVSGNHGYVAPLGFSETDPHSYYAKFTRSDLVGDAYIFATRVDTIGGLSIYSPANGALQIFIQFATKGSTAPALIIAGQEHEIILNADGAGNYELFLDGVSVLSVANAETFNSTTGLFVGARGTNTSDSTVSTFNLTGKVSQVQAYSSAVTPSTIDAATPVLDVDFTATNVRHGDTKIKCATGQIVTINQDSSSSNDVATIIKKAVLRFDGVNSVLRGLLGHTHSEGYLFAAFTGLSTGGDRWGRVFSANPEGLTDNADGIQYIAHAANTSDIGVEQGSGSAYHLGLWDKEKNVLVDLKVTNGLQRSRVNNADEQAATNSFNVSTDQFNIGANEGTETRNNGENAPLDLEFLALFPATITDAQAEDVRNYINNRNNVFSLIDSQGYFFFNPQKLAAGDVTSWNGNITGSDLGDTDVATNVTIVQGSQTSQPNADGYSLTFEDNTQHLEWASAYTPNFPAGQTKAWQIVGTSLGTFAYLTQGAVSELNLLGNLGNASHRKAGDLYGVMLLPESATGADIEAARKLLIDRGSLDGSLEAPYFTAWLGRIDIVEFKSVDLSNATSVQSAWQSCTSMTTFPALNLSSSTTLSYSWYSCSGLSNFGAIQAPVCTDFSNAWLGCSALTSFPAAAKLGTSAQNVNFSSAFYACTALESLPAGLDLSQGNAFNSAFQDCSSLATIGAGVLLGTASASVDFTSTFQGCGNLVTLPANLNLSKGDNLRTAFYNCTSLVTFPAGAFDTMGTPVNYCFLNAWLGCSALSGASVDAILDSIDTSGQSAPATGPHITIDYDTGTTAPAYTALASLKAKGWVIVVNNVTL